MSLDRIVELIIKDCSTTFPYMRAIRLFEFQVAVFNPTSFNKLVAAEKDHRAPSELLRIARIFSAIRFLETIEEKLRQDNAGKPVSIKQLAEDRDYQSIFDDVIAPNGGWRRIRRSRTARSFDRNIANQCEKAETVAKYIDFSYRYDKTPIKPDRIGGRTAARYVVMTAPSLRSREMARTTSKDLWSEFRSTAPFLYLLLIQKVPLMPPKVGSKNFSDELMKQAEGIATLRGFFRAYQHLCEALKRQRYNDYDIPQYNLSCEIPQFKADPFEPDVVTAFEDQKAKSGS
jgi:hypothetical protein